MPRNKAKVIARALRDYGAVIADTSGLFPSLKLENLAVNNKYSPSQKWQDFLGDEADLVLRKLKFTPKFWVVKEKGYGWPGASEHRCEADTDQH